MNTHIYIKYAIALLIDKYDLKDVYSITPEIIKNELINCQNHFSLKPYGDYIGKDKVPFEFSSEINNAKSNVYLSPNCITSEKNASHLFGVINETLRSLKSNNVDLYRSEDITQSVMPISGEFCSFSKTIGRGKPKSDVFSKCLSLITSTTTIKPCLQVISGQDSYNVCILPNLEISDLINFIELFKRLSTQKLGSDIMYGDVKADKPKRPKIFRGNFPGAPYSSSLGPIALLGAIGEMTKEQDVSELARKVLKSLEKCNIYMIKYGDASVFSLNHHIIDFASQGKLKTIVDSLFYVELYNQGKRSFSKDNIVEYQKFDLFVTRFLQMFNKSAFKDFLFFRAEYPTTIELLLKVYFINMEKISEEIVKSAIELGKWLNKVAYISAVNEYRNGTPEAIRSAKAKVLVEIESSIFSSKSGSSLISHTIARAGRLSNLDAPAEALLFMEKTASGELPLDAAKEMIIAFSRVKYPKKDNSDENSESDDVIESSEEQIIDFSNI